MEISEKLISCFSTTTFSKVFSYHYMGCVDVSVVVKAVQVILQIHIQRKKLNVFLDCKAIESHSFLPYSLQTKSTKYAN